MIIKPHEVSSILNWYNNVEAGANYQHKDDMIVKYTALLASWKAFKLGIAPPEQQRLCYEIHKCLMKGILVEKRNSAIIRGFRVASLVKPDPRFTQRTSMNVKDAVQHVAGMDKVSTESVRKQWARWKNASEHNKKMYMNEFMSFKKFDFK